MYIYSYIYTYIQRIFTFHVFALGKKLHDYYPGFVSRGDEKWSDVPFGTRMNLLEREYGNQD